MAVPAIIPANHFAYDRKGVLVVVVVRRSVAALRPLPSAAPSLRSGTGSAPQRFSGMSLCCYGTLCSLADPFCIEMSVLLAEEDRILLIPKL
jgi:hypothetical protein